MDRTDRGPGTRQARARCTGRLSRPPHQWSIPRSRPRASRRGLQHSSTSVPDDEPEPDRSKRHGWWHFAATLVQSRWRGWAGRRRYLRHRRAARLIQAHYRRWRSRRLVRARHPRRFVTRSFTHRSGFERATRRSPRILISPRTQARARDRAARDAAAARIAGAWRRHVPARATAGCGTWRARGPDCRRRLHCFSTQTP